MCSLTLLGLPARLLAKETIGNIQVELVHHENLHETHMWCRLQEPVLLCASGSALPLAANFECQAARAEEQCIVAGGCIFNWLTSFISRAETTPG